MLLVNVQSHVEVDHKKEHDLVQTLHLHMVEKIVKDLLKMNENVELTLVQVRYRFIVFSQTLPMEK